MNLKVDTGMCVIKEIPVKKQNFIFTHAFACYNKNSSRKTNICQSFETEFRLIDQPAMFQFIDISFCRYMVSSKFEPVSARRAFPCFDEPNIKANFTVHLVHKNEYIALSNMPEEVSHLYYMYYMCF